jgi:hypothetical protein
MKTNRSALLLILLAALSFASATARADTLELTGAPGPTDTGFVTGPYQVTDLSKNTSFLVICDDFTTDVSMGHTWAATAYTLASLSSLKFGTSDPGGLNPGNLIQEYQAAFFLADQLAALPNTAANTDQIDDLSYAIWGIFSSVARQSSGYALDQDAQQLAASALGMSFGTSYFNRTIYTPSPLGASQEYLTVATTPVPEPSTILLLMIGVVTAIFISRRHKRAALLQA